MSVKQKKPYIPDVTFKNAKVRSRNFEGRETLYNRAGQRNFLLLLDSDQAEQLAKLGWNVKVFKERDPEEVPQAFLKVTVRFDKFPPTIYIKDSAGTKVYGEKEAKLLDHEELTDYNVVITPYQWSVNGNEGCAAYLKKFGATLVEDEFEKIYRQNVPDSSDEPPFDDDVEP